MRRFAAVAFASLFALNIVLLLVVFLLIDRGRIISPASARVRAAEVSRLQAMRRRSALAAGALLMLALIFGTALLQRWDTLTQQMIYSLIYAALIATLSWDRWSVDALRSGPRA